MAINHLHVDWTFDIILEGNPTTGYEWTYKTIGDPSVLSIQGTYVPNSVNPGIVGSGGKYVFHGKALKPGKVSLIFSYARSWETVPPVETKRYNFSVTL